ncbi:MAG: DUF4293 domain-containing protein [Marinilabiliaceae bacterium]|nr:DUF4293 domain-containing protein [Marinilabiliaceae bacterium]
MIQRKQTIYLLLAVLLTTALLFVPLADFINKEVGYVLNYKGIFQKASDVESQLLIFPAYPLLILIPLSIICSVITIFIYKKRILQIRLCAVNIALMFGITGSIYYLGYVSAKNLEAEVSYNLAMVFPLIGIILTILAMISIGKDEALVRSLNRIR